ncbi:MAG: PaaI family thioesterase [Anaerolineae bacterium]|nr:PaaI family thioesterase [Anaerolineae bacterium]
MTEDPKRSRTVTWDDPSITSQAAQQMSGREFQEAMRDGRIPGPPIAHLLDFQSVEVGDGRIVFACTPAEYHYNPIGVVHGGLACTLLDSALACAIHTKLPAGVPYTTIELHVNFLRPLTVDTGPVRCEAEVIHIGRSMATAQGRLIDAHGKLYAHGTTTCLILRGNG